MENGKLKKEKRGKRWGKDEEEKRYAVYGLRYTVYGIRIFDIIRKK
jgi:hypothetical protein